MYYNAECVETQDAQNVTVQIGTGLIRNSPLETKDGHNFLNITNQLFQKLSITWIFSGHTTSHSRRDLAI